MSKVKNWALRKMVEAQSKEEGQGLAEYGLILALVAVVAILALTTLGQGISDTLDSLSAQL